MDCLVLQYCEIDRGAEKLLRFQYLLFRVNYRGLGGGDLLIIYSSNSAWYFHLGYSMLNFSFKNFMTGQLEREK